MKTQILKLFVLAGITLYLTGNGIAQEKSRKQIKEEKKIEKQRLIDSLVSSKEFEFSAKFANPQGGKSINLSGRLANVKFFPDSLSGDLPFFGKAYASAGYGGDGGIIFDGKPEVYEISKKGNEYIIIVKIKGKNDAYELNLSISQIGTANLSVTSINRNFISYSGEILIPEKKK
jgi:hypothetical protein